MNIPPEVLAAYRETFFPYAADAIERAAASGGRFVYYTSAATALQVLRNREIWMRNTMVMNDFSEVDHGIQCLISAYRSDAGARLDAVLDGQFPGLSQEIKDQFNAWVPGIRRATFVACISEHPSVEDQHGRLSMWRAYGGNAGVALVLNGGVLFRPSDALAAYSSPVAYLDDAGIADQLRRVAERMAANTQLLESLGRDGLREAMFHMLRFGAVCTKHPAFWEEREWRVVASPPIQSSPLLQPVLEVIGGIPQQVLKIPLRDHPAKGLFGLEPNDLLDRVLIGPCEHSSVIFPALLEAMTSAGVANPASKIFETGIPLRPNQR